MKTTITYILTAILSIFYMQSATAQDTIATYENPEIVWDMIATKDGNLVLSAYNYVKKVTTEGEELWTFEGDFKIFTSKIVERQNGNFLVEKNDNTANLCELDNSTGEILRKCNITHPNHSGASSLYEYVEMPDQSVFATWRPNNKKSYIYITQISENLSNYNFLVHSGIILPHITTINGTQIVCSSVYNTVGAPMGGTKVYDLYGGLISNNIYTESVAISLTRLDDNRFISLNKNAHIEKSNLLFCDETGDILKNVEINKISFAGDMVIDEENQMIYIAIGSYYKKDSSTTKSDGHSIWSVNFDGEVIDSMFFTGGTYQVGITHYEDNIYYCFGDDSIEYLVKIPKSELVSIKETKSLETNTYPNPAKDVVYFMWESQNLEHGKIDIIDLQGKVVASATIDNNSATWHCENFANGIYLYRVTESGKTIGGGKIVVRH